MTPAVLCLGTGEAHVWTAALDDVAMPAGELAGVLSGEETERAGTFVHAVHRRRYVAAHVFLRSVLSRYTGLHPGVLRFGRTGQGKPTLLDAAKGELEFSLTNSGSMAACVVARSPVGIDLERDVMVPEQAGIAPTIFAAARLARWSAESEESRSTSFVTGWTQFEALAKAEGGGLVAPPAPIDIDVVENVWSSTDAGSGRWSIVSLRPAAGYILSVAIRDGPAELSLRGWPGATDATG